MPVYEISAKVQEIKPDEALNLLTREFKGVILSGPRWTGKTEILKRASEGRGRYCKSLSDVEEGLKGKEVLYIDDLYRMIWEVLSEGKGQELILRALKGRHVVAASIYELEWLLKVLPNLTAEGWGKEVSQLLSEDEVLLLKYDEGDVMRAHSELGFKVAGLPLSKELKVGKVSDLHRASFSVKTPEGVVRYEGVVPKSILAEASGLMPGEGRARKVLRALGRIFRGFVEHLPEVTEGVIKAAEALALPLLEFPLPVTLASIATSALLKGEKGALPLVYDILRLPLHVAEEMEKEQGVLPGVYSFQGEAFRKLRGSSVDGLERLVKKVKEELEIVNERLAREFKESLAEVEDKLSELLQEVRALMKQELPFMWRGATSYATADDVGDCLYYDCHMADEEERQKREYRKFVNMLSCPEYLRLVQEMLRKAERDVVLVIGPSGSGKTSLLYFAAKYLEQINGAFSYLDRPGRGLGPFHVENRIYLLLNDPSYEEFKAVWGSPYRKYVIMAIRDQILEEFLRRYAEEERRPESGKTAVKSFEDHLREAYDRAITIEYEDARSYLRHLIKGLFGDIEKELVEKIVEKAKSSWHAAGKDRVSPSLYYVKLLHEDLEERNAELTLEELRRMPDDLLELEASRIINRELKVSQMADRYMREKPKRLRREEREALARFSSWFIPLVALAINGRLHRDAFEGLLDFVMEWLEEKGYDAGEVKAISYFVVSKGADFIGFPHDSWEILLDVTPLNREYKAGEEGKKLELLMELIMEHLAGVVQGYGNIRARFTSFVNDLTYEALKGYEEEFFEGLTGKWYSKLSWKSPIKASGEWRFRVSVRHLCRMLENGIDLKLLRKDMLLCWEFWKWIFEDLERAVDKLIEAAANGVEEAAEALEWIAKANKAAFSHVRPEQVDKLIEAAANGVWAAVKALEWIAKANKAAFSHVRPEQVGKLIEAAANGVEEAAEALYRIAEANKELAPKAVDGLIEAAANGVEEAAEALYRIAKANKGAFSHVSSHKIKSLIDSILDGNYYAAVALGYILMVNRKTLSFITEDQLQKLIESAVKGSIAAIQGLRIIAFLNDLHAKEAVDGLVRAAIRGHAEAAEVIEHQAEWYRDSLSNVTPEHIAELRKAAEKGVEAAYRALKAILFVRPDLKK